MTVDNNKEDGAPAPNNEAVNPKASDDGIAEDNAAPTNEPGSINMSPEDVTEATPPEEDSTPTDDDPVSTKPAEDSNETGDEPVAEHVGSEKVVAQKDAAATLPQAEPETADSEASATADDEPANPTPPEDTNESVDETTTVDAANETAAAVHDAANSPSETEEVEAPDDSEIDAVEASIDVDSLPDLPLEPEPEEATANTVDQATADSAIFGNDLNEDQDRYDDRGADGGEVQDEGEDGDQDETDDPTENSEEEASGEDDLAAEIKAALEATAVEDEDENEADEAKDENATPPDAPENENNDHGVFGNLDPRIPIAIGALGMILGMIGLKKASHSSTQLVELQSQFQTFKSSSNAASYSNEKTSAKIAELDQQLQAVDQQIKQNVAPIYKEIEALGKFKEAASSKLKWNTETIQLINLTIGKLFDEKVEGNRARFQDELVAILKTQTIDLVAIAQAPLPPLPVTDDSAAPALAQNNRVANDNDDDNQTQQNNPTQDAAKQNSSPTNGFTIREHKVQLGDTINALAAQYNIPVASLLAANPDIDPRDLKIGQTIYLPPKPKS